MARKSNSISDVFILIGALVGITLLVWVVWLISLFVLAGLIFAGLSLFSEWHWANRLFWSFLSSFLALKAFVILATTIECFGELLPDWWFDKNKRAPCPHCGKRLRTGQAKQCLHCGADWHENKET